MDVPRSVDTSNLSSVTSVPCPAQHKWSADSLADFNNEWISLPLPTPPCLQFHSHQLFHIFVVAGAFVHFHGVSNLQEFRFMIGGGCSEEDALWHLPEARDCDPEPRPVVPAGLSYWPSMPVPEEPQNFDSLMGFVMPLGLHLVHGWEEKNKNKSYLKGWSASIWRKGEMAQTLTYTWDLSVEGSARPLANWLLIRVHIYL